MALAIVLSACDAHQPASTDGPDAPATSIVAAAADATSPTNAAGAVSSIDTLTVPDHPDPDGHRSDGCRTADTPTDTDQPAPAPATKLALGASRLPGTTATRLLLLSVPAGARRRDAILDVDTGTLTWLGSDTGCGSYFDIHLAARGVLYLPDTDSVGRVDYRPRLFGADGSSRVVHSPGAESGIVSGNTLWAITVAKPTLFSVDLATGARTAWAASPAGDVVRVAGVDASGRVVVSVGHREASAEGGEATLAFDPQRRAFEKVSDRETIAIDPANTFERTCDAGSCRLVHRSPTAGEHDLGPVPPGYPHIELSPTSRYAVVTDYRGPSYPVTVIDTVTAERTLIGDDTGVFGPADYVAWSPDGAWLFTYLTASSRLVAWTAGLERPIDISWNGLRPFAIAPLPS